MNRQPTAISNRAASKGLASKPTACAISADDRFITDRQVADLLGSSRGWPWKLVQDGRLPAPIRLTERCTRWRLSEIRAWMADPQGWQEANRARLATGEVVQ